MKSREGDFVETVEGLVFDVKGLVHPPDKIVAYLRYLKDPLGERKRGNTRYSKVYSLKEREDIIRRKFKHYLSLDPVFGAYLQEVPHSLVSRIYEPTGKIEELSSRQELDSVQRDAVDLISLLHEASKVNKKKIGLSGSVLVDLHKESSDLDILVYGKKNCLSMYTTLEETIQESRDGLSRYTLKDLEELYSFRVKDTQMPFKDFLRMEDRKFLQGKFKGRDFFVRFLLDWHEVEEKYGDTTYASLGCAKVKGLVEDDSESLFTPCKYVLSKVEILKGSKGSAVKEVASFRGRFCKQAEKGETVVAQGKLEKVIPREGKVYFRVVLGASPSDLMISYPRI